MTVFHRWISPLWLSILVVVVSQFPGSLLAQESTPVAVPEPPAFLLEPVGQDSTYFTVTMDPGMTQELTVALGNAGQSPVSSLAYVSDAYTLVNGGFGVETPDDDASEPTTWIDFPTETLELTPGEQVERTFSITVPDDAAPGQYIAGLSIQTAESIEVGETDMLRQIIKKSIAVFIIVPGPEAPALEIGEVRVAQEAGGSSLVIDIRNPGNVFLNPAGTVEMTSPEGERVLTAPVTMGPVYAGTNTTLDLHIPTLLEPGIYSVSVALEDEETGVSAGGTGMSVPVDEPVAVATPVAQPVTIDSVSLDQITAPDTGDLQAVNVGVALANPAAPIPSAQLTLHVSRDGELVEDYPLNSSLVVQTGTTQIQQRYVPLGSWEPGTYSFALTLEAVDPGTGQVTVLARETVDETITVP